MSNGRVRVVLNVLVNLINRRGCILFSDAAKMLDLDESSLEDFVRILVGYKILEIEYSAEGDRFLKKGDAIQSTIIPNEIKAKVDAALDAEQFDGKDLTRKAEAVIDVQARKKEAEERSTM